MFLRPPLFAPQHMASPPPVQRVGKVSTKKCHLALARVTDPRYWPPPRRACSSVVEHCVDIAGVASSILATPTIERTGPSNWYPVLFLFSSRTLRAPYAEYIAAFCGVSAVKCSWSQRFDLINHSLDLRQRSAQIVWPERGIEVGRVIELIMAHEDGYLPPCLSRHPFAQQVGHRPSPQLHAGFAIAWEAQRQCHRLMCRFDTFDGHIRTAACIKVRRKLVRNRNNRAIFLCLPPPCWVQGKDAPLAVPLPPGRRGRNIVSCVRPGERNN